MRRAEAFNHNDENPLPQAGSARLPQAKLVISQNESAHHRPAAVSPSSAFADALETQHPGLRRYAMALAGNAALADDLVQDCIARALGQEALLRDLLRLA